MDSKQIFMGAGEHSLARVGELYLKLGEAIEILGGIQQPPSPTEPPLTAAEKDRLFDCEIRLKQIAKNIYTSLTGEVIVKTKKVKE